MILSSPTIYDNACRGPKQTIDTYKTDIQGSIYTYKKMKQSGETPPTLRHQSFGIAYTAHTWQEPCATTPVFCERTIPNNPLLLPPPPPSLPRPSHDLRRRWTTRSPLQTEDTCLVAGYRRESAFCRDGVALWTRVFYQKVLWNAPNRGEGGIFARGARNLERDAVSAHVFGASFMKTDKKRLSVNYVCNERHHHGPSADRENQPGGTYW